MWSRCIALISLWTPTIVFAHGMNKPGPHGGFIVMPGSFHVEMVPAGSALKVYLLDDDLANPVVSHSELKARIEGAGPARPLKCSERSDHFLCDLPKDAPLKEGQRVFIEARRGKSAPGIAIYKFPFKRANQ